MINIMKILKNINPFDSRLLPTLDVYKHEFEKPVEFKDGDSKNITISLTAKEK